MGERICSLGTFKIGDCEFNIELNHGTKQEQYMIHIQNERFNLAYKDVDFIRFAGSLELAAENFLKLKDSHNE